MMADATRSARLNLGGDARSRSPGAVVAWVKKTSVSFGSLRHILLPNYPRLIGAQTAIISSLWRWSAVRRAQSVCRIHEPTTSISCFKSSLAFAPPCGADARRHADGRVGAVQPVPRAFLLRGLWGSW